MILKELKSTLNSDRFVVNFSRKIFGNINEIEFDKKYLVSYINLKSLNEMLSRFSCLKILSLKHVDIDNCINTLTMPNLEELKLFKCQIQKIDNHQFNGFENLRVLELKLNNIKNLCPQAFHNLFHLEKLDISCNLIKELPDNIFSQLPNLKSLDLSYNPLSIIKTAMLNGLHSLEHFFYEFNQNTVFEKYLFKGLDNLKDVSIREDCLTEVSMSDVDPPKNLEKANVRSEKNNSTFLKWLNSESNLKKLALCHNNKNEILHSFNCYGLEELTLSNTYLDIYQLPANLNKLKMIKLEKVTFLKDTENLFSNLKHLEDIEIKTCEFLTDLHENKLWNGLKNLTKFRYIHQNIYSAYTENTSHIRNNDDNIYSIDNNLKIDLCQLIN